MQNFALQTAIEKKTGGKVESLKYIKRKNPIYPNYLKRCRQYSFCEMIYKSMQLCMEKCFSKRMSQKLKCSNELFDKFNLEYIHRTELQQISDRNSWKDKYDLLIIGSDQVWNPNVIDEVYVGEGTGIKRIISYAASIGREYVSDYEANYIVGHIEKMDAISVREQSAKRILENAGLRKSVEVVVDPTMLLTREDWDEVAAQRVIKDPYVFVYSFSDCKFKQTIVDFFAAKGIKVYFIPYAKRVWNSYDGKSPMEPLYDVGPREFLSLIKNAEMVFTDSFHGAVLSIIFNKPFYVFERNKKGKTSMNTRLSDLLTSFELNCRLIKTMPVNVYQEINYSEINKQLEERREKSLHWLFEQIQDDRSIK
ncbi:MAG: polysaccharide pyruvyl transferase family protein [Bacteroidales bacterium]|nr:polysaccharide pyruvyl transferase family protein [Bacteroidales bacterium]